ncbi:hypothetical protein [Aestuariibaculum marinum]|uniref:Cytochrome c domain-containing protein n=1 Tax=Aestuariibaculum marinum TaxID=2683592 RepID=A0A8J6PXP2_9FLAO|nr:hypothetical protein [Aestuariibaculum marinum]MBD0823981.1 hypothetical protein [Aestuariibaculum marinum]
MKTKFLTLLVLVAALSSCKNNDKQNPVVTEQPKEATVHPGKKLMETYCYSCHDATTSHDNRLAPPMIAIKKRYISANTTKEEFTEDMLLWMKKPSEEISKMPEAVERFGVMPIMVFPDRVIKQISEYMYNNDIAQPEWFEAHFKEQQGKRKGMGMNKSL